MSKFRKIEIKRQKTFELKLTRHELIHLRDLFSVLLPADAHQTMSQHLAALEGRPIVESILWKKVADACTKANLPMGEESPDYIVAPLGPPAMSVFHISSEPPDGQEQDAFGEDEEDDEDDEDEDSEE